MNNIIAIGIAGGTGSGKTTITKLLSRRFGTDVSGYISRQLLQSAQ